MLGCSYRDYLRFLYQFHTKSFGESYMPGMMALVPDQFAAHRRSSRHDIGHDDSAALIDP